jgi:uncharacterized coiled-coil protein SlyX
MYISQLEARSKELEEASKKASENTKITDKIRNDINRKNEDIRKANKDLASQQKTIQELQDKVAAMTDTIESLEDDAMESRVNSDMTKQEIQDSKEEFAKMETRLEFFINENASLKDENTLVKEEKKALLTQIEQLDTSTQAPREPKSHKDDNTSNESIPPQQQPQVNHEGLTKALYFSEAQCDILESENKLLKAKLARLMARQRESDDIGMNDSILKRQHLLYYSPDEYDQSPSHDFALDTTLGNTQSLFHLDSAETTRKLSVTKSTSPIASAPYPSRRSNNEMPQDTLLKKPVKRTNTGLLMPPSSVVPAKTKASGSSARAKKSLLEKFIKNPSKYQTKSTPIPLTQLERTGKEVLPHSESQKEASPTNTIPLSRETTPTQSTSQPESSKTQVSPPPTVNEEAIIPKHATNDSVTTKASNVAAPLYLGKRFFEDTTDDESEIIGRTAKATKLDLSLDSCKIY